MILIYFDFFITVTESLKIFGIDETIKDLIVVVFQDENQEKIKTIQVKLVSQELLHFGKAFPGVQICSGNLKSIQDFFFDNNE